MPQQALTKRWQAATSARARRRCRPSRAGDRDADATIDKAIDLLGEAAAGGATLVVFPECFVSVYPSGAWAAQAATWTEGCDELWERMWTSSIDVSGPQVDRLTKAFAERGVHLAIGINEREDDRPGSLYNSAGDRRQGVLHRHRKLMPTMHERVFHGVGAGEISVWSSFPEAPGWVASSVGRTECHWRDGVSIRAAHRSGWHRPRTTATAGLHRCDHRDRGWRFRGERAAVHTGERVPG